IWGKQDTLAPLRTGKLLAHVMPRAALAVIERAGHEPMRETPDRFRDVLEPFLERGSVEKAKPREPIKRDKASCERKHGAVYEGAYDTLVLNGCRNVFIGNARVRELRVINSSVVIEDSDIGGGEVGLTADNAVIEMTGGRIEGGVAISIAASRLDLAGVQVEGKRAAVQAAEVAVTVAGATPPGASVVFSISRVRSPHTDGEVHGYYAIASGKPPL
ncbi:MAG TPA: alpha/beta hydrolase, partial [Burkholderiales bacterium]|nr:alpha/beta hydrolase [Burkholderiales bacterium]